MWVAYNRARRIITLIGSLSPLLGPSMGPFSHFFSRFLRSTEALHRVCPFHKPDHRGSSCVATLSYSFWPGGRRRGVGHILKPFLSYWCCKSMRRLNGAFQAGTAKEQRSDSYSLIDCLICNFPLNIINAGNQECRLPRWEFAQIIFVFYFL